MDIQKTSKTELPLTKQVRLERSPEKTCQKKTLFGKILMCRKSGLEPWLYKSEKKRTADPIKLKGEANEEKNTVDYEA